ncbi:hypothetical protein [Kineococcus rhizosphaerae]|uniref:hypothetical protein n=1 Tax=Kineococcus rhizosphaerae TaxID=559628 RepID=UPI000D084172|nr:hypothetical protein [Kineococcus rhizosphaerae]
MDDQPDSDRSRAQSARFTTVIGAVVFVLALVLLLFADDRRSLVMSLMLVFVSLGLGLVGFAGDRRWVKTISVASSALAVLLAVYGFIAT